MKKVNNTTNVLIHRNYVGSIEFSLTDNCLFGKVQGLSKVLISYEGLTLDELKADFKNAVDEYLEDCEKQGIEPQLPFKGVFNVRLNPELHKQAAIWATKVGVSLNGFIKIAVEREISTLTHKV